MTEHQIDLDIITLTHGGRGLGRHEGMAVFVPFTAPGDRVRCRLVTVHKRYAEAELVEVLEPSPGRREAPCPLFGQCGGCQWQHLPLEVQADWKGRIFGDLMSRAGILPADKISQLAMAPDEWRYRSRVQFKCRLTDQGFLIGFYRSGSHFIIDAPRCLLLSPSIQATLDVLRREFASAPANDRIPQIDVSCGDNDAVRVIVHVLPEATDPLRPWLRDLALPQHVSLCMQSGRKETLEVLTPEGSPVVIVDASQLALKYSPGGFAQVNLAQNRRLVADMLAWLDLQGEERVLDLFCGMGNLSLPLARRARELVGVEDYAPAIADARDNATANRIANATFRVGDAAATIREFTAGAFDLVVLDPPRTGSLQVARELLRLAPQRILYVSCDPATLVRDLKPLVHNGYRVVSSRAYDFFPQTWHVESMTLLDREAPEGA